MESNKEYHLIHNGKIAFFGIFDDQDAPDPFKDFGGNGKLLSAHRHSGDDPDEIRSIIENEPNAVVLSCFDHTEVLWWPHDAATPLGVEFQWDGVAIAGVWTPTGDNCALENIEASVKQGKDRKEALLEYAQGVCHLYTCWCNGWCYYQSVAVYPLRKDEEGDDITDSNYYRLAAVKPIAEDSCGGYYPNQTDGNPYSYTLDFLEEEMATSISHDLELPKEEFNSRFKEVE